MDKVARTHILFVDDDEPNLLHFYHLMNQFFKVSTANSGGAGLEVLNKNLDIKVVIADIKMPKMSGLEFIEIASNSFNKIKFIVLTGYLLNEEITNAMESGIIAEYIQKPYDVPSVVDAVNELIQDQ